MPTFTVFKGQESGIPKQSTTTKPDQLTGDNVFLRVTASGVCGTDLHHKRKDIVLGHEGVGVVESVGPECHSLKRGDRVGWGFETDCCGHCIQCLQGTETYCPDRALYSVKNLDQGSFASHAIWRESFLYPIPEGLSDSDAAPLQCGGATTFNALQGIKPGDTVGVMGVGGLGHLAIQFAAKMGCHVVVLSGSERKKAQALELGAHEFIATKDAKKLEISSPINRFLVTAAVPPDWELILPILAPLAAIYPLTVSNEGLGIPNLSLNRQGISVQGSLVAPRHVHRKMLEFAAANQVKPVTETFPMTEQGIKQAMDKLERGEVTYRAVLLPKLADSGIKPPIEDPASKTPMVKVAVHKAQRAMGKIF